MLIWITKALLTHQTGLWWFHFYWSDIHHEGDAGIRPSKFPLSVFWKDFSVTREPSRLTSLLRPQSQAVLLQLVFPQCPDLNRAPSQEDLWCQMKDLRQCKLKQSWFSSLSAQPAMAWLNTEWNRLWPLCTMIVNNQKTQIHQGLISF